MDDKDNKNEIDRIEILHTRMAQYVKEKTDGNIENFGKLCGVAKSTMYDLMSAASHKTPRLDTLIQIANYYNISLDWLLGYSDIMELSKTNDSSSETNDLPSETNDLSSETNDLSSETNDSSSKTSLTYKDMIEQIEEWYDDNIVKANFQVESVNPRIKEYMEETGAEPFTSLSDMYDDTDEYGIQWTRPDVLKLNDTFLAVMIITLYYVKIQQPYIYNPLKEQYIEKFGNYSVLGIDISKETAEVQEEIIGNYKKYKKVDIDKLWESLNKYKNENP